MTSGKVLVSLVMGMIAFISLPSKAAELIMFDQVYCEWCEAWEEDIGVIYNKTDEGRRAPVRRVDIHDPRPEGLEQIKGVVYTPTFVLMDGGTEIGRITGYPGEDFFWPLLDQLMTKLEPSS